jgi:hypothetical protein
VASPITNMIAAAVSYLLHLQSLTESHRSGLNRRPFDYESSALPLSYCGDQCGDGATGGSVNGPTHPFMPWRGLEPRRLAAPPPQDGVSTNFTTRATRPATPAHSNSFLLSRRAAQTALRVVQPAPNCLLLPATGLTGLEPATSGVTDRHSNQLSYSPKWPRGDPSSALRLQVHHLRSHIASRAPAWSVAPTGIEPVSPP